MSDADRFLELIEDGVAAHGGDLGGWTRRDEGMLQLFDGRVTLRADLKDGDFTQDGMVHAHVLTTLHEHDDEVLDACLFGMGEDRDSAMAEAAMIWITSVAGPIKSFTDGAPVCMTCQAGVTDGDSSAGYVEGDYGLTGLRAYVGPGVARGFDDEELQSAIDDTRPWFRYAAESAAPRRVHMAKSTVVSEGASGWRRELEIDGHEVSYRDPDWPAGVTGPEFGYLTRFAVFEFPRNSNEIRRRAELDRTIRHFAQNLHSADSVDALMESMIAAGFDEDFVGEVESISTIAFGRTLFEEHGVQYPATIIRARRDGRIETDVPLMSLPAFCRARAIAAELRETMSEEAMQSICLYNAESHAILQAMDSVGDDLDLSQITMYPCVVPERGVSQQTMDAALAKLNDLVERGRSSQKKPWWKFW